MPYALGIDLGTARTVAALSRNRRDSWSEPVVVPLETAADRPGVASVLHFTGDDTVEVGESAGHSRADRVARDFLDRIGDEVPLAVGGQHYPAESLAAALVAWVVDRAEALEGTSATQLVVTHPVGWGAHRRAMFQAALRELNLPDLTMLPRPVAAAESYAATERLEVGEEVAVYSLGAGRFEAAVLRRGSFGFELRSHADSTDVLGGALFDDLLAEHATADLGEVPGGPGGLAAFRAACVAGKERLSSAVAVTIPAPPGAKKATVLVNRTDFDLLIRPVIEHTVRILQRAIAGADSAALRAVVLVGGCANVPLIAELVSAAVRVRVVAADDPTTAIARGAAVAAGRVAKPTVQAPAVPPVTQHTDLMRFDDLSPEVPEIGPPPPRPPVELAPLDPPARGLARLTRRIRPAEDPDDLDLRDEEDDDEDDDRPRRRPPKIEAAEPEDDDQEVDLLTHTKRPRPGKDADFLAHLRGKTTDDAAPHEDPLPDGDDLITHRPTRRREPAPHNEPPATSADRPHDEEAPARRRRTDRSNPHFAPAAPHEEPADARPSHHGEPPAGRATPNFPPADHRPHVGDARRRQPDHANPNVAPAAPRHEPPDDRPAHRPAAPEDDLSHQSGRRRRPDYDDRPNTHRSAEEPIDLADPRNRSTPNPHEEHPHRRRADHDPAGTAANAELPGPRNRTNHAAGRHQDADWSAPRHGEQPDTGRRHRAHDEPALAHPRGPDERHRRRRHDAEDDA